MQEYDVPGLVIAFARGTAAPEYIVLGSDAARQPLTTDSLFPVASISKLATALAVLRLINRGEVSLDEPIARYLPDSVASAEEGVTLRTLLSHTSGLPNDVDEKLAPYDSNLNWEKLAQACLQTPLKRPPRSRVRYSNAGYGLLAIIVERQTHTNFPIALKALVLEPLGIEAYLGAEPPRAPIMLSDIRSSHRGTELEPYNSRFYRSLGIPWGGLVTTVDGALAIVRAFAGIPENFLSAALRAEATRNQTDELEGGYGKPFEWKFSPWGLGPDLRDDKQPHWAPPEAARDCFGHAGASGCVAWFDPEKNVAWAILGTRSADNGWLLRGSPKIGAAILNSVRE